MATDTPPTDIPALLRFLTQSASLPLLVAMRKVDTLQRAQLTTPSTIASASLSQIRELLFPDDEKAAKALHNAAKRVVGGGGKRKKDGSTEDAPMGRKKRRKSPTGEEATPAEIEASLVLPSAENIDEATLRSTVLFTNRAPLCLAFAVVLLQFTMPRQPLSSQLSLAQAMVSLGARAKAQSLGLAGTRAEEEGWGEGQPVTRVMGRDIRVLRRWGYEVEGQGKGVDSLTRGGLETCPQEDNTKPQDSQSTRDPNTQQIDDINKLVEDDQPNEPALWGLDLEALKKSNGPPIPNAPSHGSSGLPIYNPQSARAYLLKSFATAGTECETTGSKQGKSKKEADVKERNLALLLSALALLYQSWAETLGPVELDRRAWSWYVAVRPDIKDGVAGWGGKGEVKISQILDLRRAN